MTEIVSRENHFKSRVRSSTRGLTAGLCVAVTAMSVSSRVQAQVFTVGSNGIESRYADVKRTHVPLSSQPLLQRTKLELVRVLDAEQGFAMRPLPKGSKGLTLEANGGANPSGADYVKSLQHNGVAFDAAARVMVTDVKIYGDRIVFEFNGGPDHKHKILRHISIGGGGMMTPLARDDGQEAQGVRLTLQFEKFIPELTGDQVKELLMPLVDFKLKTPIQAYVDTLPPKLRDAILNHHVLVGMSPEMVVHALGHPDSKSREREGNMPFEEWIYGQPPKDVEFVRFNGNRVIQVEEARLGEPPVIRKNDEMGDYWNSMPAAEVHEVKLGDVNPSTNQKTAAPAPPSLRKPGETLPANSNAPQLEKVQFPPGMEGSKPPPPSAAPPAVAPGSAPGTSAGGTAPPPGSRYIGLRGRDDGKR